MASIVKEFVVGAPIETVWDAFCDFGEVHERVARGFVVSSRLDGDTRHITFANGLETDERLVSIDEEHMRVVYSASSSRLTHHNGAHQFAQDEHGNTRITWTIDVLPEEAAANINAMMDAGVRAVQETLGSPEATSPAP